MAQIRISWNFTDTLLFLGNTDLEYIGFYTWKNFQLQVLTRESMWRKLLCLPKDTPQGRANITCRTKTEHFFNKHLYRKNSFPDSFNNWSTEGRLLMCDVVDVGNKRHGSCQQISVSQTPKIPCWKLSCFPGKPETNHKNILFTQQQIRLQNTMVTHPIPVKPVLWRASGDLGRFVSRGNAQAACIELF